MKKLFDLYPEANAIYDCGQYYGIAVSEDFYLIDKSSLETVKSLLRYEKEVIDLIEKAIPIYYDEDAD